jgi:radical SAM-linked protein
MKGLMDRCEPEKIAVSLPSLRVGSLTPELMTQIKRVRKTGFTLAPEAGSQRLRDVINKNITEEDLGETVENAFGLGWQLIKLYFMIGLPTETAADLDAIVNLVKRLQKAHGKKGRNRRITASVSTFIPKAHTPFQWCSQVSADESAERIRMLRSKLRGGNLRFKWQNAEMSLLEGLWARGDRTLSRLLVKAYEGGCRFDGWSDQFDYRRWKEAIEACGVDTDRYTTRPRDLSEPLPWDHVDSGVSKEFLKQEWERALDGQKTPDCRHGDCQLCGVCDFEVLKPVVYDAQEAVQDGRAVRHSEEPGPFKKLRVAYAKQGPARYFGHLELVKIFVRAIRRAGIPLRFSQGFHPAPKIAFECALPVGIESLEEYFTIQVPIHVSRETLPDRVNPQLPEGLRVKACDLAGRSSQQTGSRRFRYLTTLKEGAFSKMRLEAFLGKNVWLFTKRDSKGRSRTLDLKPAVKDLRLLSTKKVDMILEEGSGPSVRPTDVLGSIFGLSEEALNLALVVKRPAPAGIRAPEA